MSRTLRRFELLLPLRFNNGQPVPDELVADTLIQLEQRFGAVSCETQTIRGLWQHEGQNYRDDLVRVFVDVPDVPANREFFIAFKEQVKSGVSTTGYLVGHVSNRSTLGIPCEPAPFLCSSLSFSGLP